VDEMSDFWSCVGYRTDKAILRGENQTRGHPSLLPPRSHKVTDGRELKEPQYLALRLLFAGVKLLHRVWLGQRRHPSHESPMARYNGRLGHKTIERDFPHFVDMAVPPWWPR
jgi:hypothetical protein